MGATTPNTATFPQFSALAGELRNQIWNYALPDTHEREPSLFFYRMGLWSWQDAADGLGYDLVFRDDLLERHIEAPIAFVNREARGIAMRRIRELGLVTRARSGQCPVFIRDFEPEVDAIYIKPNQLHSVVQELIDTMTDPSNEGRNFSMSFRYRKIAMSETSLISNIEREDRSEGIVGIADLLNYVCSVREVLVVVNTPADLESTDEQDKDAIPLWTFSPAPGDAFSWSCTRSRFEICGDERVGDGVVSAIVESERVNAAFTAAQPEFYSQLKVRPVYAIRR
jgi:hypothetical protein